MKLSEMPIQISRRVSSQVFATLYEAGLLEKILRADRDWLTALSYHRIYDLLRPDLDTYTPNISATPEGFRRQMEYVREHYNIINCEHLALWLRGKRELPPRPAIVTFDDGYRDNLDYAYPILRDLGVPATIFLSTDSIGSEMALPWDLAAYCFFHTKKDRAVLPLMGSASWKDAESRDASMREWLRRAKASPDAKRLDILHALAHTLEVNIPPGAFSELYLNWDHVRELDRNGIEMGAHTATHPSLTNVPLERAEQEIFKSKERIEAELGKPVISFAYPNGGRADFSTDIQAILRQAGFEVAFTLVPGPTRNATVKKDPLAIRRVSVSRFDTLPRFLAKLAGFARLKA